MKDRRPVNPSTTESATDAAATVTQMTPAENPVVASLPHRSPHPYSSIAFSPDRRFAVTASKNTLQVLEISPSGIRPLKTIPTAQHFSSNTATSSTAAAGQKGRMGQEGGRDSFVFEALGFGNRHGGSSHQSATPSSGSMVNVVITDVAWSHSFRDDATEAGDSSESVKDPGASSSLVAAAGSNGVILVWDAAALLEGVTNGKPVKGAAGRSTAAVSATAIPPEAVLRQHVRAVNRLAWHPKRPGFLLSASQDATVLLWERRRVSDHDGKDRSGKSQQQDASSMNANSGLRLLFGGMPSSQSSSSKSSARHQQQLSTSWVCRAKFEPKSEAVRDLRWSPYYDDVFALVTSSGSLIAYHMHVPPRALFKMTAHSGDATTLDWHPTVPGIIATGGANDRSVKVWNLEKHLSMNHKDDSHMASNMNTMTSVATEDSSETDRSISLASGAMLNSGTAGRNYSPLAVTLNSTGRQHKTNHPKSMLHVLAISASVTRLRWRPPVFDPYDSSMLAVATAPIKGASAGGAGVLALWSYHRPFMPLSVVQGHKDGAVTDFVWLETPVKDPASDEFSAMREGRASGGDSQRGSSRKGQIDFTSGSDHAPFRSISSRLPGGSSHEVDAMLYDNSEVDEIEEPVGIWQHVLSVGRDGRCLIQSFVRGDRPISRVPPSCFAMANLSPFQKGYGSLQLFSVCQPVPDPKNDFFLTGLRCDNVTSEAPGIFREVPPPPVRNDSVEREEPVTQQPIVQDRYPPSSPELFFNVIDQGDLDRDARPVDRSEVKTITVAPEVVHLSRFASRYLLYPNEKCPSRAAVCLHNANVAEQLSCDSLAHMWTMMASMLESCMDELPDEAAEPRNVMQFVILPTVKNLMLERSEDGDVQTAVYLCEVLQVITKDQTVRVPGLDISLIREWYLSYIDLLRDMCLFSHASFLIRSCNDQFIGSLNQQSTTVHESCPRCGKPIQSGEGNVEGGTARRACRSCRGRVGLCFLCHEPVKGVYVWCPGCGHGGHLEHALQWFGGLRGKPVREVCPTGCGHKCNAFQQLISFPRTESAKEIGVTQDKLFDVLPPGLV